MKLALAAIPLAMLPSPASAEVNAFTKREIAYQVLGAVDAAQTCTFIRTGRAVEANPIAVAVFGSDQPSCGQVIGFKLVGGALHWVIASEINKRDPEAAKWFQIATIVVQGGVVAANLRFVF